MPLTGLSKSALRRRRLSESDPDTFRLEQQKEKERHQARMRQQKSLWATGTRAAQESREAYLTYRRDLARRHREKKWTHENRVTRTTEMAGPSGPSQGPRRKDMTPEERRLHDNAKRRDVYHAKSSQKKTARKKQHAAKMREHRLKTKETVANTPPARCRPHSCGQTTPNATSTPLASCDQAAPGTTLCTPPKRQRMRQHCYNVTSKVKKSLRMFDSTESAAMTYNLVMTRTPDRRKRNIETLIEHPAFRRALSVASYKTRPATKSFLEKTASLRQTRYTLVKKEIQRYYLRPAVSRVLPHKRYGTRHGPGHVLLMTVDQAYKLFTEETGKRVSRALFAKMRQRNVRKLGSVATDTCLCICCTNVKIKIDALNRLMNAPALPSEGNFLRYCLCYFPGKWPDLNCVEGRCLRCKDYMRFISHDVRSVFDEEISWTHWERRPRVMGDGQTSLKLDVFPYKGTVFDILTQLGTDLAEPVRGTSFFKHLFNAYWQQSQYTICKDGLLQGQLMMVQDFAKNRQATYTEEVKSAFFGKQQITMHPSVCYYKDEEGLLVRHVVVCFSDDVKHDAHLVHVITAKTLSCVQECAAINEAIIWSDGAASQYKGRKTFADLTMYGLPIERHFFGSEHGKGESDAETGRFSQALRRATAGGQNFRHAQDMVDFAVSPPTQVVDSASSNTFFNISLEDVIRDRPEVDVGTIPGTRSFHQVVKKRRYCVAARTYSCFCSGCRIGNSKCCINKAHVKEMEIFKMVPSVPQDEAFINEEVAAVEEENLPMAPVYSNTECPSVGQWLDLIGKVQTSKKKKTYDERSFKAVVINKPDGGFPDFFYVQFLKRTSAGSFVITPEDISHISPDTPETYRWRVVPAPVINNRNHHFFSE